MPYMHARQKMNRSLAKISHEKEKNVKIIYEKEDLLQIDILIGSVHDACIYACMCIGV